ncbi:hypothetical protein BDY24DRAFT_141952 [Mrakia frigida]|uniref:uncharacterized protein n=1 Tax=Mrakia frigida TaxID=29902 RepID=UPI003FCBF592
MAFAPRTPEEFDHILASISSAHIEKAASPRPPTDPSPSPLPNHQRNLSSTSSSHPSIYAPTPTSYQQQQQFLGSASSSSYLQQQQPPQDGGWGGGETSFDFSSFDLSGSGGSQQDQGGYQPTNSYGQSFQGGEVYTESSLLGGATGGMYGGEAGEGGAGGGQATSSSSSSFSFNQPQQDFSSYQPSSSSPSNHQQQQQQPWMFQQQQPPQPSSSSSNTFDFSSQPLPQFNFITTNPPSPAPDPWANPSLLHRSTHSHSPAHSYDGGNDHRSSRSRASSVAGSARGGDGERGGPSSYEGSVGRGSFDFSQSSPAAMDEAMRGLTFEDLALIASAGGSPLPQPSFNLPPSPDPQQHVYDHPSSPSYSGSHHTSPFPHTNPSPPSFNIAYSPASNPASPSPPAQGGSSKSPPSLIIPPDPTEASIVSPQAEQKPSSASSLFPPVDPRMAGVMRLATEGGGVGGPQINIVPSTPTSGQLAGQIFSEHLAELNRRHQEQQQQQQAAPHPLPHQSPSARPQPPLHSLDTASPHASFGFTPPPNGPSSQQQQQAPSASSQDPSQPGQQFTSSQSQFVAMMSMQMAQQQLASQQMAQYQQQQAMGAEGGAGGAPSTPQAWMARLAQMNQWQGGVAQQQQPYGSTQQQEQLRQHQFPHLQQQQQPPSSYQPYTFNQPPQQQQQPQHHFPNPPYQYQPTQPSSSNLPRQLKAPPIRQRSRSEASLIPYDFGPPVPQAPTMDPSLLPGSRHDPNSSFFPPLTSPNTSFNFSADPASLSDDGTGSHQGSLPSPSTFSFPFFMAPVRQPTGDDGMVGGGGEGIGAGFGFDDGGGGGEVGHPRRASFGQRAFGPGTPEYGRGLLNPWGRGGGGEDGDDGGIGGSGVGVRRSSSDAGGKRKGHRKVRRVSSFSSLPFLHLSVLRSLGADLSPSVHSIYLYHRRNQQKSQPQHPTSFVR